MTSAMSYVWIFFFFLNIYFSQRKSREASDPRCLKLFSFRHFLLCRYAADSFSVKPISEFSTFRPPRWILQTQKSEAHLLRTQSSKVLPFESRAGPYIVMHATRSARNFFFARFYNSGQFTCISQKTLQSFLCWLWLTPVPIWVCRIK